MPQAEAAAPVQRLRAPWRPIPDSSQEFALDTRCDVTLYHGARGPGKRLHINELVLTSRGWVEAGRVVATDYLVAPDGTWTRIAGIFPARDLPTYRVTFDDGASCHVDGDHRWMVYGTKNQTWRVMTTLAVAAGLARRSEWTQIPLISAPAPGWKYSGYDPYIVGVIIGDGTMSARTPIVYTPEPEIQDYLKAAGWVGYTYDYRRGGVMQMQLNSGHGAIEADVPRVKGDEKHIPDHIIMATPDVRLAVLQGLMDTDGHCDKEGRCEFKSVSEVLANQVAYLARSLGGKAHVHLQHINEAQQAKRIGGRPWIYRVKVTHCGKFVPFRLPRHVQRLNAAQTGARRRFVSIDYVGNSDGVCFAVEHPSHLFVIRDFIVTHNTDAQIMRFRRRVGMGYGAFWRGVIFDREYKMLDDIVTKSRRHFSGWADGAKFLSSSADYKWVWPTGEELLFRQAKKPADYWNYHGQEFPYIGWNELCKYPTPELFEAMMSCNRSSFTVDKDGPVDSEGLPIHINPIPLEVFATANPYGPGHGWVKRQFIDPAPSGTVVRTPTSVFNPKTQQRETVVKTQVAIFGSYRENIYLDAAYVANLENERDPNKRKAWLLGDWNIVAGGALDDVWRPSIHVLPRFAVPEGWRIDRAFDWGSSHPAACTWWAETDGTEVLLPTGAKFCPPKGSIVCIAELYFNDLSQTNVGLKWSAGKVAESIRDLEVRLLSTGPVSLSNGSMPRTWIGKQPWPGPADNQIRNVIMSDIDTIETQMQKVGIRWTSSDKSKGSRAVGLQLVRDRLYNSIQFAEKADSKPGLYVMTNCRYCISTVPVLPRDEQNIDDVDTEAEDHLYDTWRYRCLAASNRYATHFKFKFPT